MLHQSWHSLQLRYIVVQLAPQLLVIDALVIQCTIREPAGIHQRCSSVHAGV